MMDMSILLPRRGRRHSSFFFLTLLVVLYSNHQLAHAGMLMNQIDMCWRMNPNWANDRQSLADCAVGFGRNAQGGQSGSIYVVTDPSDNDPAKPTPGTLRYGATRTEPLWIVFDHDMSITLKNELIITSYKTIDGRGAKVEIAHGPCLTIQDVSHIIIHGISVHHCTLGKPGLVMSSVEHVGHRDGSDGDAIAVFGATDIWIDHCSFASCADGLVDIIHGSTDITVSNCVFANHDKVMLLGHEDGFSADENMRVTVAFNHFGPNLVQRMPRVRTGYAHVANNNYEPWKMYAIGGSSDPTIFSQGNYFDADGPLEVTKREVGGGWSDWKWRSSQDFFSGGAFFVPSGFGACAPQYSGDEMFTVLDGSMAPMLTSDAGVLSCDVGSPCVSF